MAHLRGGMEFRHGRPVRVPEPPTELAAAALSLSVTGDVVVKPGDRVDAGAPLAREGEQASAAAPVAGTVRGVSPWPAEDQPGLRRHLVSLDPAEPASLTTLPWTPPARPMLADWLKAMEHLGPWPQDGLSVSLRQQLIAARHRPPQTLLGVGLDIFPPYPDRTSILGSFRDDVLLGLSLLGRIVGAREVMLACDRAATVTGLRGACRGFDVRLRHVENIYPWASPTMLLHEVSGEQVRLPFGGDPMPHGYMLVTPWTAVRIARAVTHQALDLCRPVFLAYAHGERPLQPVWAFPGQTLATLDPALSGTADELSGRLVIGDPMSGRPAEAPATNDRPGVPAIGEADQLLSMLTGHNAPRANPCIHCGWCVDVCPTRLRPIQLVHTFRHSRGEPAFRAQVDWCIDCGLCSHVCPSHIPIAQTLRAARQQLRELSP